MARFDGAGIRDPHAHALEAADLLDPANRTGEPADVQLATAHALTAIALVLSAEVFSKGE